MKVPVPAQCPAICPNRFSGVIVWAMTVPSRGELGGEAAILTVVTDIIGGMCEIGPQELTPERRIGDLGLDSLVAGEIIAQAELALNIDINFRQISHDWSALTLGDLAAQLWAGSRGRA